MDDPPVGVDEDGTGEGHRRGECVEVAGAAGRSAVTGVLRAEGPDEIRGLAESRDIADPAGGIALELRRLGRRDPGEVGVD